MSRPRATPRTTFTALANQLYQAADDSENILVINDAYTGTNLVNADLSGKSPAYIQGVKVGLHTEEYVQQDYYQVLTWAALLTPENLKFFSGYTKVQSMPQPAFVHLTVDNIYRRMSEIVTYLAARPGVKCVLLYNGNIKVGATGNFVPAPVQPAVVANPGPQPNPPRDPRSDTRYATLKLPEQQLMTREYHDAVAAHAQRLEMWKKSTKAYSEYNTQRDIYDQNMRTYPELSESMSYAAYMFSDDTFLDGLFTIFRTYHNEADVLMPVPHPIFDSVRVYDYQVRL